MLSWFAIARNGTKIWIQQKELTDLTELFIANIGLGLWIVCCIYFQFSHPAIRTTTGWRLSTRLLDNPMAFCIVVGLAASLRIGSYYDVRRGRPNGLSFLSLLVLHHTLLSPWSLSLLAFTDCRPDCHVVNIRAKLSPNTTLIIPMWIILGRARRPPSDSNAEELFRSVCCPVVCHKFPLFL